MPSSTGANMTAGHSRRRWPKKRVGEEPWERVEFGLNLDILGEKKHVFCVAHSVYSTPSTDINYLEAVSGKRIEFEGLLWNPEGREARLLFQSRDRDYKKDKGGDSKGHSHQTLVGRLCYKHS